MFAAFTPVAWPAGPSGYIADPSGRTCIVSLINVHDRSFRLNLHEKEREHATHKGQADGPMFG